MDKRKICPGKEKARESSLKGKKKYFILGTTGETWEKKLEVERSSEHCL